MLKYVFFFDFLHFFALFRKKMFYGAHIASSNIVKFNLLQKNAAVDACSTGILWLKARFVRQYFWCDLLLFHFFYVILQSVSQGRVFLFFEKQRENKQLYNKHLYQQ